MRFVERKRNEAAEKKTLARSIDDRDDLDPHLSLSLTSKKKNSTTFSLFLSLSGLLQEDRGQGRRPLHRPVLRHVALHRQVRGPEADAAAQVEKNRKREREREPTVEKATGIEREG